MQKSFEFRRKALVLGEKMPGAGRYRNLTRMYNRFLAVKEGTK
jgi:hypothetical protein